MPHIYDLSLWWREFEIRHKCNVNKKYFNWQLSKLIAQICTICPDILTGVLLAVISSPESDNWNTAFYKKIHIFISEANPWVVG